MPWVPKQLYGEALPTFSNRKTFTKPAIIKQIWVCGYTTVSHTFRLCLKPYGGGASENDFRACAIMWDTPLDPSETFVLDMNLDVHPGDEIWASDSGGGAVDKYVYVSIYGLEEN